MNETKGGTSKRRKVLSAALAIAMALTMLLSGTLAYFYQSKATNVFSNEFKEAYGHDDFIEGVNKDVYVENTGNSTIYVRVKLEETFTMDGKTVGPFVHKPAANSSEIYVGTDTNDNAATSDPHNTHQYFTWEFAGAEDTKAFKSALSSVYVNSSTSKKVIEDKVAKDSSGDTYEDGADDDVLTTAATSGVITMYDYLNPKNDDGTALEGDAITTWQKSFQGWVMDNADGWIYWSQPVEKNSATGLLLDNVTVSEQLDRKDYKYDIDVSFQAVDETDIANLWIKGLTFDEDNNYVGNKQKASANAYILIQNIRAQNTESDVARIEKALANAQSEGAQHLYSQALANLHSNSGSGLWRLFEEKADAAERLYQNKPAEYWEQPVVEMSGDTVTNPTGMDAGIASYLLDTYADGTDSMNRDQALGVYSVAIVSASKYKVTSGLLGLTGTDFPSLSAITLQNNAAQFSRVSIEETLKPQLTNFCISGSSQVESIDLSGCSNLIWIETVNDSQLTEIKGIDTLPVLDGLVIGGTAVTFDYEKHKTLSVLGINANFFTGEYGESNRNLLKNSQYVQFLRVGADVQTTELDLSGMTNLSILECNNNQKIQKIILPETAFSKQMSSPAMEQYGVNLARNIKMTGNTALQFLNISVCTEYLSSANLAGATALKGVTRRWDQAEFTNYPNTTTVYERIKQKDGSYLYKIHENGNKAGTPTEKSVIAQNTSISEDLIDTQIFGD